jgi:hypothetical protein
MNTIAKVSVASALALGYVSAHASGINVPGTTAASDVMLFAEVVSGTTVLGSYAGDTQVTVGNALPTSTNGLISASSDANLATLISLGLSAGNTIEWGVMGGQWASVGNVTAGDTYLTTLAIPAGLALTTGVNASAWSNGLQATLQSVAANAATGANSVFASTVVKGGVWDATDAVTATSNASNWYDNGSSNVVVGLGSSTLYDVTSGTSITKNTVTADGTLTLTANGLTYTAQGSGSPVPLPAAIWLLGSGLLGLAGVGRRKAAATT